MKKQIECLKCGGTGYISEYSYIAGGVCFTCKGSGKVMINANSKRKSYFEVWAKKVNDETRIYRVFTAHEYSIEDALNFAKTEVNRNGGDYDINTIEIKPTKYCC